MNLVQKHIKPIITLCQKYSVKELYAFGSVLTGNFNKKSDIDLLVKFDNINPAEYFNNYMDLKENLEAILNREIDLVEDQAVKNPIFRKIIDREKTLIYERKDVEVLV
jgi:uncharacterized protein